MPHFNNFYNLKKIEMKNLKYILLPVLAGVMFHFRQNNEIAELDAKVETAAATDKMKADCDAQIMQAAQLKKR